MTEIWGPAGIGAALIVGAVVTYFWRAAGVALSGRLRPDGAVIAWVGCVAYALLAALIARMIVFPIGPLAETTLFARLAAAAVAFALFFFLWRRALLPAVIAGAGTLVLLATVQG